MSDPSWGKEWLDFAQMDHAAATHLLTLYPVPLEIICFHCEQAGEKALKGFLAAKGEEPPKTHDLSVLCDLCAAHDQAFQELAERCASLTPYGVQTRYPSDMDLEDGDATYALDTARQIIEFVQKSLGLM